MYNWGLYWIFLKVRMFGIVINFWVYVGSRMNMLFWVRCLILKILMKVIVMMFMVGIFWYRNGLAIWFFILCVVVLLMNWIKKFFRFWNLFMLWFCRVFLVFRYWIGCVIGLGVICNWVIIGRIFGFLVYVGIFILIWFWKLNGNDLILVMVF